MKCEFREPPTWQLINQFVLLRLWDLCVKVEKRRQCTPTIRALRSGLVEAKTLTRGLLSYHCLLSVRLKSSLGEVVDGFMERENRAKTAPSGSLFSRSSYRFGLKTPPHTL
jgi:hypothetical protein